MCTSTSKSIVTDRRPSELRAADDRIAEAQEDLADAEAHRHMLIVRLVNASPPSIKGWLPYEEHQIVTENPWICEKSPVGCCVYEIDDRDDDPDCIYCHESSETRARMRARL